MKTDEGFIKLTVAALAPGNKELVIGQTIHILTHRLQAYHRVKDGVHQGTTRLIMNTSGLSYYVEERPREIRDQLEAKASGKEYDTKRKYDDD